MHHSPARSRIGVRFFKKGVIMISRARTAMKFFVYGLLIGIFFAPRSGKDSRNGLIGWVSGTVKNTLGM